MSATRPGWGRRVLRGSLLALTFLPILGLGARLDSHGAVPWFYDWPFVAAVLVVALVANHYRARLDLPPGETAPHWADSAIVHELTRVEVMSDEDVKAQLEELSRRPDQAAASAESEALLRRHFNQRKKAMGAELIRQVQRQPRNRIGNAVLVLLLAAACAWGLYVA